MKTKEEIQNVLNWLGTEDADDPCDDLPFIENIRAFREALNWVLNPTASQQDDSGDMENKAAFDGEYYIEYIEADVVHLRRCR